jgi:polyketide cyclase/dehydrase/lipid transport protein
MVSYSGSAVTKARPEDVWAAWVDVGRWSDGDVIESARLAGDFREGSTIISKAKGFPRSTLTITRVEPYRVWVDESRAAGTRMTFEHLIEPDDAGTRITERVVISGPLSAIVGMALRRRLQALFAATTAQVARQAESATQPSHQTT